MDLRLLKCWGWFGVSGELGKRDGSRGEEGGVDAGDEVVVCGMGEDGGVGGGDVFAVSGMDVESVGNKVGRGDMAGFVGWDDGKETRGDGKEFGDGEDGTGSAGAYGERIGSLWAGLGEGLICGEASGMGSDWGGPVEVLIR